MAGASDLVPSRGGRQLDAQPLGSAKNTEGNVARPRDIVRIWGTTVEERKAPFPCDELLPDYSEAYFRAISVQAEPPVVFRWLCQLRVAPYSYDWIDNRGRQSPRVLTPGLERLSLGQPFMKIFDLAAFELNRHLTLRLRKPGLFPPLAASYLVSTGSSHDCRLLVKLVVRLRPELRDRLAASLLPWLDWIMMRRQLLSLKELSESTASVAPSRCPESAA